MATLDFPEIQGVPYYQGHGTHSANTADTFGKTFFAQMRAARKTKDPIIRATNYCNFLGTPNYLSFFEALLGTTEYCSDGFPWQVATMLPNIDIVEFANTATVTIAAGATSAPIPLDLSYQTANGNILPQVGGRIAIASPDATFFEVTAVSVTVGTPTVTLKNNTLVSQVIPIAAKGLPFTSKQWNDCNCPVSLPTGTNIPLLEDFDFMKIDNKLQFCGKELQDCEFNHPFEYESTDTDGKSVTFSTGVPHSIFEMQRNHEEDVQVSIMTNKEVGKLGVIPQLRNKAIIATSASSTQQTQADIEDIIRQLQEEGITCRKFIIRQGKEKFKQTQALLDSMATGKILYGGDCGDARINEVCKSLNLNFCTLHHLNYTLVFQEETNWNDLKSRVLFKNYDNAAIWYPMDVRGASSNSRYAKDPMSQDDGGKMGAIVYRKVKNGTVYDRYVEQTGYGTDRNNNEAGCTTMHTSIQTHVAVEIHCAKCFILQDLP